MTRRMGWSRWCRGLVAGVSLWALLAGAGGAQGQILLATSILPPGESAFVSLPGVANGTGSPHLYDQQQLFISFQRKNAMFFQPGSTESPMASMRRSGSVSGV